MLKIDHLTKTFRSGAETVTAVNDVSIEVAPGELLVLLGPSGCGKTTALRCLAGLESAGEGRITFGDRVVFDAAAALDVAPEKHDVGMVFQSYALWPHKTVRENIAYPLKVRKMKAELSDGWVENVTQVVDCTALLDRYPGQLSGGQQQRVALARGLVARPQIVLFDEPLSNLDALLRMQVRNELHELHQRLQFTAVYVTHDQTEALALGDRLAVMKKGRIDQIGTSHDIYEHPVSEYVAQFVGFANAVSLERSADGWQPEGSDERMHLPIERDVSRVKLRFRPQQCTLTAPGEPAPDGVHLRGQVVDTLYAGTHEEVTVTVGTVRLTAELPVDTVPSAPGHDVIVTVPFSRARWFDDEGVAVVLA